MRDHQIVSVRRHGNAAGISRHRYGPTDGVVREGHHVDAGRGVISDIKKSAALIERDIGRLARRWERRGRKWQARRKRIESRVASKARGRSL